MSLLSQRKFFANLKRGLLTVWPSAASGVLVLVLTGLMFLVVEGATSVAVVLHGPSGDVLLERQHTAYDAELGWINEPNVRVENLYGPGRYLQTNSQRFRAKRDFLPGVSAGHVRAICTGDSFTLGYGVGNDDCWCEVLGHIDPRFEMVNMGQGGYGVDQAYLWYRRDGTTLRHDVLIFAFIEEDFVRMMNRTFLGYPKPVLSVESGAPVVAQRPSRSAFLLQWLRQRTEPLQRLRFVEWWHSGSKPAERADDPVMNLDQGHALAVAILEHLRSMLAERGAELLVVLLPIADDYRTDDPWRAFLVGELSRRQIPFTDLVGALKEEPVDKVPSLFRGHYSELGNRWVADHLYPALTRLPKLGARLEKIPEVRPVPQRASEPTLEQIAIEGSVISASQMGNLAPLAIDGLLETRWHSGAPQRGGEEIVLDLARAAPLRRIELDLGTMGYDFGRSLEVDLAGDDGRYFEALRAQGEVVATENGEAQLLTLPASVLARHVRIRQLGRADENFWSICEIKLYRDSD